MVGAQVINHPPEYWNTRFFTVCKTSGKRIFLKKKFLTGLFNLRSYQKLTLGKKCLNGAINGQ